MSVTASWPIACTEKERHCLSHGPASSQPSQFGCRLTIVFFILRGFRYIVVRYIRLPLYLTFSLKISQLLDMVLNTRGGISSLCSLC